MAQPLACLLEAINTNSSFGSTTKTEEEDEEKEFFFQYFKYGKEGIQKTNIVIDVLKDLVHHPK